MCTWNEDMSLNIFVLHIGTSLYLHVKFDGPMTSLSRPNNRKSVCEQALCIIMI